MNQRQQDRQLTRIPRIIATLSQLESRNPEDLRIAGLESEYARRMAEVKAFSLSDAGKGFENKVDNAIASVLKDLHSSRSNRPE